MRKNKRTLAAALFALLSAPPLSRAADTKVVHQVKGGSVVVNLPLTVGGSFDAKTTAITGELTVEPAGGGAVLGECAVDLKALDTGIDLRNTHLKDNYLEVGKGEGFDRATLSGLKLACPDPATFTGKTSFTGTFGLHGVKKEVKGEAQVKREGNVAHVEATFPITVSDFEIKKPTYLGVGVKNEIKVKVALDLVPVAGATSGEAK